MEQENRLLADDEILAFPDGTGVYVEVQPGGDVESAWYTKSGDRLYDRKLQHYDMTDDGNGGWRRCSISEPETARAWLREPTPAELTANPWP